MQAGAILENSLNQWNHECRAKWAGRLE